MDTDIDERKNKAEKAALLAIKLADELVKLSELDRWFDVRIDAANTLFYDLNDKLIDIGIGDPTLPDRPTQPAPKSNIVYIPVGDFLCSTRGGAMMYAIPGFIGGRQQNGVRRPDGKRSFPVRIILKAAGSSGLLGVGRDWLEKDENSDLVTYLRTFLPAITLF